MVFAKRKRGRPSRAELDARNGGKREKSPVSQAQEESPDEEQEQQEEDEEELIPAASIPDTLQTLLETLSQQVALILEQNARIEQRITCLEQGISRIDQQNGLLELQNDRIEQQIARIEQRTVTMEEQLNHFSTLGTVANGTTQTSGTAGTDPPSTKETFSIQPATTGEEVNQLDAKLEDETYRTQAIKWLEWNVYEDTAEGRMNKTMDLLISPALQAKCYWNAGWSSSHNLPVLKSRMNILSVIKEIGTTEWETVTAAGVKKFFTRKLRLARRNQPRARQGIRLTVNSSDETSVELDDDTSIDSSIDFGDDNDDGQQQQQQQDDPKEDKLIEEEPQTGNDLNDDDTSLDLDEDDVDSIDDELEDIEFE